MSELTPRQVEIAELVARGLSNKAIARAADIAADTVDKHIRDAAARLPGDGRPRYKVMLWALTTNAAPRDNAA